MSYLMVGMLWHILKHNLFDCGEFLEKMQESKYFIKKIDVNFCFVLGESMN